MIIISFLQDFLSIENILVECFFMKACSFRQSQPTHHTETFFSLSTPTPYYGIQQCCNYTCHFCYERLDLTKRFERAMRFTKTQQHRFVNQYQIYLNANVVCKI
jgi:hypothetical protein